MNSFMFLQWVSEDLKVKGVEIPLLMGSIGDTVARYAAEKRNTRADAEACAKEVYAKLMALLTAN